VNLILEQLCVEGNRKQAKYAVSAIAAMTADSGLKALSVLYGVSLCLRLFCRGDIFVV
jgi:sister-chromatid-cohesion protein PDS5